MMLVFLALLACSGTDSPPPAPAPVVVPAPEVKPGPRVAPVTEKRVAASHILIAFQGAVNALPNVTRSREEARTRADEVHAKVLAGEDFASLARIYSDDSTGGRGGDLGGFDDGTMVKPFEDAVKALPVGGVSDVVETPFGFHVIRRDALMEIHAAHLLITWSGAERAPQEVSRSKDDAKARADEAVAKLVSGGDWATIVRTYSDGPAKEDAGDLGWFGRDQLSAELDKAAFDLDIGETSAIVETARGYHLMKRLE